MSQNILHNDSGVSVRRIHRKGTTVIHNYGDKKTLSGHTAFPNFILTGKSLLRCYNRAKLKHYRVVHSEEKSVLFV